MQLSSPISFVLLSLFSVVACTQAPKSAYSIDFALKHAASIENVEVMAVPNPGLPDALFEIPGLKLLQLRDCRLSSLPAAISKAEKLTILDLTMNQFTELPPEILGLEQLQSLAMSGNPGLDSLPPGFGKLESLSKLFLDHCNLEELPAEIVDLKQLNEITLFMNPLKRLPARMSEMAALSTLSLPCSDWIDDTASLRVLTEMPNLKVLYVDPHCLEHYRSRLQERLPEVRIR